MTINNSVDLILALELLAPGAEVTHEDLGGRNRVTIGNGDNLVTILRAKGEGNDYQELYDANYDALVDTYIPQLGLPE